MHLTDLLHHYGYITVFVAGLFEGETVLMLGAYGVHEGYLRLVPLIACGAAAAFITDQFYFFLARRQGAQWLARRPRLRARVERVTGFVERHPVATIFAMRFAWGFRIVLPATLGLGRMPGLLYSALNALAVVLWSTLVVLLGVRVTAWVHGWVGHLRPYEHPLIVCALTLALGFAAFRHWRARR